MGRHFFSYHLDEKEEPKVQLNELSSIEYGLDIGDMRVAITGELKQIERIIRKALAMIEEEKAILALEIMADSTQEKARIESK